MGKQEKKVEDQELENQEVETKLDWKAAAENLKNAVELYEEKHSIDDYNKRMEIMALRKRYNDKERTEDLHEALMALEGVE